MLKPCCHGEIGLNLHNQQLPSSPDDKIKVLLKFEGYTRILVKRSEYASGKALNPDLHFAVEVFDILDDNRSGVC